MCGLAGFWQASAERPATLADLVGRMVATLVHRGPDDCGVWADERDGVALGFRRLSILDLSPTGHQPMSSADGRFVCIFNGEIYNHRELRADLERTGARFRGHSDTEVIVEGASRWGLEAVIPLLWGMFAIAMWDRQDRTLLVARDRVGKKPLYYADSPAAFLFGSELKALRVHPAFRAEVDRDAVSLYLRYGYVPAPHSIYKGVRKLPVGSYMLVRQGRAEEPHRYWDARRVIEEGRTARIDPADADAIVELDVLLRDAVARRMITDVPLGAFLSGGIDSSTVVALMQAQSSRAVKTFTIGFDVPNYDEAKAAGAVARHLGTDHTELYVTPAEARAVIPRLPDLFDEPFADSSQIPTCLVSSLARRHVTVSLSGDGGDEIFGGYNRHLWAERIWRRTSWMPSAGRRWAAAALTWPSPAAWDHLYRGLEWGIPARWQQRSVGDKIYKLAHVLPANAPDDIYRALVSQWRNSDLLTGSAEPAAYGDPLRLGFSSVTGDFTEAMMLTDLITYLPDDILVKVDRATMGVSLEGRCPLLDHRVIEFAARLPRRFKQRAEQGKWILRQVLYRYVPPALIDRPKSGFRIPIGVWLRSSLRAWAESLLDERRLRTEGFFDPVPIRRAWAEHLSGRFNHEDRLWTILMFQAWLDRWYAAP